MYEYVFEELICKFCHSLLLLKYLTAICTTRKQNTIEIIKCWVKLDRFKLKFIWQMVWKKGFHSIKKLRKLVMRPNKNFTHHRKQI